MHEASPSSPSKKAWLTRVFLPIIFVAGIGTWIAVPRFSSGAYTIKVDGESIVTVESRRAAKTVLRNVRLGKVSDIADGSARFVERVTICKSSSRDEITDVPEAEGLLEKNVTVEVEAFAVNVDGTPAVALPDKEVAEQTLRLVRTIQEHKIRDLYTQSTFKEQVFVDRQFVDAKLFRASADEAARLLTTISEKPLVHMIQPGDRAVKLAQRYKVSITELKRLNPGVNLDQITEGDQLVVRQAKRPITVVSKARITKNVTVALPSGARRYGAAKTGKRQMWLLVTYENGEPVNEEIISQVTTWDRSGRATSERHRQPGPTPRRR